MPSDEHAQALLSLKRWIKARTNPSFFTATSSDTADGRRGQLRPEPVSSATEALPAATKMTNLPQEPNGDCKKREENNDKSSALGVSASYLRLFLENHYFEGMKTWQLKKEFVVPATKARRCAFVKLLQAPCVAKATVFVSHAYSYDMRDTFEVMLEYECHHPGSYFWFDPFSLNQHGDSNVVDTAVLEKAFGEQIRNIGAVLIVASPWTNPAFLSRAWCLFELLTSVNQGVVPTIRFPQTQRRTFLGDLRSNFAVVYKALGQIDSRKARAKEEKDLLAIRRAVERTATFANLNKLANEAMRKWLVETAMAEESRLRTVHDSSPSSDAKLQLLNFQTVLTIMLRELGLLEEAQQVAEEALQSTEAFRAATQSDVRVSLINLAQVLHLRGRLPEATLHMRRALKISQDLFGSEDERTLVATDGLGSVLLSSGNIDEAEPLLQRASDFAVKELGPKHHRTLVCQNNLALLHERRGNLQEAELLLRRVVANSKGVYSLKNPDSLAYVTHLASILQKVGKLEEAERLTREALAASQETLGARHPGTLVLQSNMDLLCGGGGGDDGDGGPPRSGSDPGPEFEGLDIHSLPSLPFIRPILAARQCSDSGNFGPNS